MTHKLVKDLNDELWRRFIAYCALKGIKVNKELEDILKEHLDKNFKKLLNSSVKKKK